MAKRRGGERPPDDSVVPSETRARLAHPRSFTLRDNLPADAQVDWTGRAAIFFGEDLVAFVEGRRAAGTRRAEPDAIAPDVAGNREEPTS